MKKKVSEMGILKHKKDIGAMKRDMDRTTEKMSKVKPTNGKKR